MTGAWDAARPTEGAYGALLTFETGAFASLIYSGYARFDSDELCGWVGEMGGAKDPQAYGEARRALAEVAGRDQEEDLKSERSYGGRAYVAQRTYAADAPRLHQHFGMILVSCERADLRPLPTGTMVYEDAVRRLQALPDPVVPRSEVIDELHDAVVSGKPPIHSGEWSLATLEACLAVLRSALERQDIRLQHQIAPCS
jgi:phthalate 4,5-cis-dihydrodiol dehydrogenase